MRTACTRPSCRVNCIPQCVPCCTTQHEVGRFGAITKLSAPRHASGSRSGSPRPFCKRQRAGRAGCGSAIPGEPSRSLNGDSCRRDTRHVRRARILHDNIKRRTATRGRCSVRSDRRVAGWSDRRVAGWSGVHVAKGVFGGDE
eukprot:5115823-Pleurochrysis_carterae.AAC.2